MAERLTLIEPDLAETLGFRVELAEILFHTGQFQVILLPDELAVALGLEAFLGDLPRLVVKEAM